ncbi:hypothetical protein FOXB_11564 [Fusarium oxysporum f. sp. conglutinans Fo5176]|uniref:Xylanolytic transcriptional activator regulatory domain-containing protein n=1 Tax=Fusarium oxysporum (strain Fo5176) TaxID=660025 RepID=F9FYT2_FUSOF|nr:hypothetical protein FOXB_11564 [Fusarium oxysporum f. sp. conglutinans Fo5176]
MYSMPVCNDLHFSRIRSHIKNSSDRRKKCDRSRPGLSCNFCIKRGLDCVGVTDDPAPDTLEKHYESLGNQAEDGRPRRVSSLVVPDAALAEELASLYFRYMHITFHNLFHRATFIAQVKDSSIPKILFFGVAGLSARYSTHPIFTSITPWDRGRPYRDETNASVEGDSRTESVYHAIASRMAMLLDLPNLPTESLLEQEINRRVWWSLITTETWSSATQSLPRFIKPRNNIPLPMDERQFASLSYDVSATSPNSSLCASPTCTFDPQSLVAQMIRLNLLLYDIIVFLNSRVVDEQEDRPMSVEFDHRLRHALDEWADNLPPRLRYSEENVIYWAEEGFSAIFITLHINYNHAGQLLFYQHLQSAQEQDQDDNATQGFAQRCKQHATNLCDLIYEAKRRPDTAVLYPLAGHILCLASTVQIHTLLFGIDDDEILAAKTRLERNFEMISSMNNYWPMNHMSISRLQHFHNACLRSKDDSFRLDAWMIRFLLGFTQDINDRDAIWTYGHRALDDFDPLRDLLDI